MSDDSFNPYSAPKAEISTPADSEMEAARRLLLKHEASVKSVGTLFFLGSIFAIVVGGIALVAAMSVGAVKEGALGGFVLTLGVLQFWVALLLRRLNPKARISGMIFAALGLVNLVVAAPNGRGDAGTAIGAAIAVYILYLLGCDKGRRVLSPEYARIVAATPHIKYKSPLIVRIFLWLLLALVVLGLIGAFISRRS